MSCPTLSVMKVAVVGKHHAGGGNLTSEAVVMDDYNRLPVGDGFYKKHLKKKKINQVVLWHSSLCHRFLLPVEVICDALNSEPCFILHRGSG